MSSRQFMFVANFSLAIVLLTGCPMEQGSRSAAENGMPGPAAPNGTLQLPAQTQPFTAQQATIASGKQDDSNTKSPGNADNPVIEDETSRQSEVVEIESFLAAIDDLQKQSSHLRQLKRKMDRLQRNMSSGWEFSSQAALEEASMLAGNGGASTLVPDMSLQSSAEKRRDETVAAIIELHQFARSLNGDIVYWKARVVSSDTLSDPEKTSLIEKLDDLAGKVASVLEGQ